MHMRREFADAIRAAVTIASKVWISIALALVSRAVLEVEATARGAVVLAERVHGVEYPTSAKAIFAVLVGKMRELQLPLPGYVDVRTIEWMMTHLALGSTRGGGRTGKLSASTMRATLADAAKLSRVVSRTGRAKPA